MALQPRFAVSEPNRIARSVSELARNITAFARRGGMTLKPLSAPEARATDR